MKILLIQPPIQDFYETDIRLQPLGLAYLKSAAEKNIPHIQVIIKDFHQGWGRKTIAMPEELQYLKPYYPYPDQSPFSVFHQYYHFGAAFDQIVDTVQQVAPDLIGISSLFSPYYREVLKICDLIKEKKSIPILLGGSHVSACPELMLAHPSVDFIIRGEGERPFVEFIRAWMDKQDFSKVPSLGYKTQYGMVLNEIGENFPLEDIPAPDFSDLNSNNYLFEKKKLSFLITSRSCPHRCSFCSVHQTFGFRYRRRSVENVIEEIKKLYAQGIRVFDFEDDNLTFYVDEMKQLCRRLIEEFPNQDVEFLAMNGISYLSLNGELLELMRKAGFTHLNLALVSSDTTVRETTKRPHTIQKYLNVVEQAVKLGFDIVSYQIIGLPNETLESMIQTLIFGARLPILLGASMFYLTPNSPISKGFPEPSENDIFKSRLTAMSIETNDFCRDDIYTLFVTNRIINFFKGIKFHEDALDSDEVLRRVSRQDKRAAIGSEILQKIFHQRMLFAYTQNGLKVLTRFKVDLFLKIWNELEWISTQEGKRINLKIVPNKLFERPSLLAAG